VAETLKGRRIAILATDGVERVELEQPRQAVEAEGATTELVSLDDGSISSRDHDLEPADVFAVQRKVGDASVSDYDGLLLPGGTVNADRLRMDHDAVRFVGDFVRSGKPVGVICHGPWALVNADVAKGRRLTSYPSLRIDLTNAGADVVDEEVVVDGNLVSSRSPRDLDAFCSVIVREFA
jgi:protease I